MNDDENNNNEVEGEDNNNGDINGNSDMVINSYLRLLRIIVTTKIFIKVDHNLEHQRLQQQIIEDRPLEARVEIHPVPNALQHTPSKL